MFDLEEIFLKLFRLSINCFVPITQVMFSFLNVLACSFLVFSLCFILCCLPLFSFQLPTLYPHVFLCLWLFAPPWCAPPVFNYPCLPCVFSLCAPNSLCQSVFDPVSEFQCTPCVSVPGFLDLCLCFWLHLLFVSYLPCLPFCLFFVYRLLSE